MGGAVAWPLAALRSWAGTHLARRAELGLGILQRIERDEGIEKGMFSTVVKYKKLLSRPAFISGKMIPERLASN